MIKFNIHTTLDTTTKSLEISKVGGGSLNKANKTIKMSNTNEAVFRTVANKIDRGLNQKNKRALKRAQR